VIVDGFTVVDRPESMTVGSTVLVRGAVGQDGDFVATRIEILHAVSAAAPLPVAFRGIVQEARATTGGSPFDNIRDILIVDEYEIHVPESLALRAGRPAVGEPVEIEGLRLGHQVLAQVLRRLPTPAPAERVEGTVLALPAGGLLGTWEIDTGAPGATEIYTFTIGTVAVIDERRAPADVGMHVEVTVRPGAGGSRRAIRVRLDWP